MHLDPSFTIPNQVLKIVKYLSGFVVASCKALKFSITCHSSEVKNSSVSRSTTTSTLRLVWEPKSTKSQENLAVIVEFIANNEWIDFLAADSHTRSNTSVCLSLNATPEQVKALVKLLDVEGVAYDIGAYRDAPAGLRIWCGATVESSDLKTLLPWLSWGYQQVSK